MRKSNQSPDHPIRLYATNQEVYEKVLDKISSNCIQSFPSQSALYLFIENIKFPRAHTRSSRPTSNVFGGNNYYSIVDKLFEDGVITRYDGYRARTNAYGYSVSGWKARRILKVLHTKEFQYPKNFIQKLNKTIINKKPGEQQLANPSTNVNLGSKATLVTAVEQKDSLVRNHEKYIVETYELTTNIDYLEDAFDLVGKVQTTDRFMQARLYHLQLLIQNMVSDFSDKKDSIKK